jgi:hypothetical protein
MNKSIKMIHFNTGRCYGGNQQFLDIWWDDSQEGVGLYLEDVSVHFRDEARSISGTVKLVGFELCYTNREIGKAVVREYDAGRYVLI